MKKIIIIAVCLCVLGVLLGVPLFFWGLSVYFSHPVVATVCMFLGACIIGVALGATEAF